MAIVKMKRLRLIGMQSDREELLKRLQRMGCVELRQPEGEQTDPEWEKLSAPDTAALNEAREIGACLNTALETLNHFAPAKGGMFRERPAVTEREFFHDGAYAQARETAQAVNHAQRRIQSLTAERGKLQNQKASLTPWLTLDVPLDILSTKDVTVQFGTIPVSVEMDDVTAALSDAAPLAQLIPASRDADVQYVFILYHNSNGADAEAVLRACNFSAAPLKGWKGTALENSRRLDGELARVDAEQKKEEDTIRACAEHRELLERCADRAAQEICRQEGKELLRETKQTFYLTGWLPAESVEELGKVLAPFSCAWETAEPTEEEIPEVPVKLKNNWFSSPLNMVTNMYVMPAYDGLDPNPLMAPFFILFFGLMMADMGYGIWMLLGGWFLLKKLKARGTMKDMGGLLVLCGISTFIFGALTGGFFGDFIPQLLKIINPESTFELPYLFSPLTDTLAILIGSLVLGVLQIITGMIISVVKKCKDGAVADAIWEEGTWFVILGGGALAVLGIGNVAGYPVLLLLGLVMLVIGSGRNAKGFGKVTALIGAVYNGVTGYFSDILSYARLMALMLAGAVIAQVFNTLGSVTGNVVTFVIISFIGNLLNFALNLLGCYVHDLRLQCLEFFNRFYKEGGRAFQPLAVNTKYVDIIKEEN